MGGENGIVSKNIEHAFSTGLTAEKAKTLKAEKPEID
jgi:hypothetical protein